MEPIDPAAIGYEPDGSFDTALPYVKRLVVDSAQCVCVAGGTVVRRFTGAGDRIDDIDCSGPVTALHAAPD